jgi:hypothetical protein
MQIGEYTAYSNGHILVALKRIELAQETKYAPAKILTIINSSQSANHQFNWPTLNKEQFKCDKCDGKGELDRCPECDGEGEVNFSNEYSEYIVRCDTCSSPRCIFCKNCYGTGYSGHTRKNGLIGISLHGKTIDPAYVVLVGENLQNVIYAEPETQNDTDSLYFKFTYGNHEGWGAVNPLDKEKVSTIISGESYVCLHN